MAYETRAWRTAGRAGPLAVLVALSAVFAVVPAQPAAAVDVAVTYTKTQDWGTGFQSTYTIGNTGTTTITSWNLAFTLAANETVGTFWDALITRGPNNRYTAANREYNATIAPGASVSFGFVASYSGTYSDPTACTLNGDPCGGATGGPPDTTGPTAPTSLRVTATTSSSVSLAWSAATDNVGVTGYDVIRAGGQVASSTTTSATVSGLPPSTSVTFTVRARDAAGNVSADSAPVTATTQAGSPPPSGGGGFDVSPYIDMGAFPTPLLTQVARDSGLRNLTLGFVTAVGCRASWFNAFDPRQGFQRAEVDGLRAMGGDVKISFGGASGQELAQACTSVPALTAEYQAVVSAYGLTYVDFDIEGAAVAEPASITRRSQAMAALQRANPNLRISLTLPVLPEGLTADGLNVVRSARDAGVNLTAVNVMAFDYFRAGDRGDLALQAAQSVRDQLGTLFPGRSDAQLWAMVGLTSMIGEADDHAIYDQADARQTVAFATQRHLGELSFWELTRDRNACVGALFRCSNIAQQPYEFSRIFLGFGG